MELRIADTVDSAAKTDIIGLQKTIEDFKKGKIDQERFRAFRLTRGIYGQRQEGVHMIRIKLPFGRVTPDQLIRIADTADRYGHGNLHTTTRQDIQLHYVKITDTPQLWADLEEKGITLREACGNTIRNMTGSAIAGIDPDEPFDISPYVYAMFGYFLRNPICQELGRKFKIAFSSSDRDTAFTFIHDLGFIPKIRRENGEEKRGFRVMLGGGLGAQPFPAGPVSEFLEEDQVIPFTEACIRIFDRFGERAKRHKARLKYLIQDLGIEQFLALVEGERLAIRNKTFPIDRTVTEPLRIPGIQDLPEPAGINEADFLLWKTTNTFRQKQNGYFAVQVRLTNGDLASQTARGLAILAGKWAADDIRITLNQGILLKFVPENALRHLFLGLNSLNLARPGFDTLHDITACPGTDTCNLGIANSMGLARELERVMAEEYPDLVTAKDLKIKISGCMNACGHHTIANIGFHGMSLRQGKMVLPGMQVLLGGGITGNGNGILADKVIKLASKKIPDALRLLLGDYGKNSPDNEAFNDYYARLGKSYFYNLLKPLSEIAELTQDFLTDWGEEKQYETLIGIGECAGTLVDMVAIVLEETREKLEKAKECLGTNNWVDSIYYSYSGMISAAKALLLTRDLPNNTHHHVIGNFETLAAEEGNPVLSGFREMVMQINRHEPSESFAIRYLQEAKDFYREIAGIRQAELNS